MTANLENCDGFRLVSYKKKSSKNKANIATVLNTHFESNNDHTIVRRTLEAKQDLLNSDILASVKASLREGLDALKNPTVKEIICLGIGKFGECMVARYQLALLLCLKEIYKVEVHVYDPILSITEINVLKLLSCNNIFENLEGKYSIRGNKTTIFYLPHCPNQLINNILWSNWSLQLSCCIIIGNSIAKVVQSQPHRILTKNAGYILSISPHVFELAIINSFKYYEIFNDLAIHVFPPQRINLISDDFWKFRIEPKYSDDDTEFVTKRMQNTLNF